MLRGQTLSLSVLRGKIHKVFKREGRFLMDRERRKKVEGSEAGGVEKRERGNALFTSLFWLCAITC